MVAEIYIRKGKKSVTMLPKKLKKKELKKNSQYVSAAG